MMVRVRYLLAWLFLLVLLAMGVAALDEGCCINGQTNACTSTFGPNGQALCIGQGSLFRFENKICDEVPECSQTGCCCFAPPNSPVGGVTSNVCSMLGGLFKTGNNCAAACDLTNPNPNPTSTCSQLGGNWCAPGDSTGAIISGASDQGSNIGKVCYSAPCGTQTCSALGGTLCSAGQQCSGTWLSANCCQGSCGAATCSQVGGVYCAVGQACAVQSLNSQVGNFVGRTDPAQQCCQGSSTATACVTPNSCQQNADETYCHDGIDNDCDGRIDAADTECRGSIQGTVRLKNGGVVGGIVIQATHANGDTTTGVSAGGTGIYHLPNVKMGSSSVYEVKVVSTQYAATVRTGVLVNPAANGIDFELDLRSSGIITGYVRDENGQPIANAIVRVANTPGSATTNAQGYYTIPSLPTGILLSVYPFAPNYQSGNAQSVTLNSGQSQNIDFTLKSFSCLQNSPVPVLAVGHIRGEPRVNLTWTTGSCQPASITVYRCDNRSAQCSVYVPRATPLKNWYDLDNLAWGKNYTYKVGVRYAIGAAEWNSSPIGVYAGDAECDGRTTNDEFCDVWKTSEAGFVCDAANVKQVARDGPLGRLWTCVGAERCVTMKTGGLIKAFCTAEQCADDPRFNPFGMNLDKATCETNKDGDARPCYYDASKTTVDFCFSCSAKVSCSDYDSQAACESNSCNIATADGADACSWNWLNKELGVGVCADAERDLCSSCGKGLNAVFGACEAQQCGLLGNDDGCYFKPTTQKCLDCENVTCYDYDQTTCGSGSSINFADNSVIGGGDTCKINVCRLLGSGSTLKCMKDADANGVDDCSGFAAPAACRRDHTPPETAVVMADRFNPNTGNITIRFLALDDVTGIASTHFCIGNSPADCGNTKNDFDIVGATGLKFTGQDITPGELQKRYKLVPGNNTIYYYSKDLHSNLEVVKNKTFFIDLEGPKINLSYFSVPYVIDPNKPPISNVTLIAKTDELSICILNFLSCDEQGTCSPLAPPGTQISYFPEHQRTISNIEDGIYTAKADCRDIMGSNTTASIQVVIDADPRAFNPQPRNVTDSAQITISVDTTEDVDCRYTTNIADTYSKIPNTQSMQKQFHRNYYRHSATLNLPDSRAYAYYAVCNYQPESRERISFTVDKLAPRLDIKEAHGTPYNFSLWHTSGNIYAYCADDPFGGFGCAGVKYCLTTYQAGAASKATCIPNSTVGVTGQITLSATQRICLMATENNISGMGGKNSSVLCEDVLVDLYPPVLTLTRAPASVNTNAVSFAGRIADIQYKSQSWTMAPIPNTAMTRFVERAPSLYLEDFTLFGDLSFRFSAEEKPKVQIIFHMVDDETYYSIDMDVTNLNDQRLRIVKHLPGREQILADKRAVFTSGKAVPFRLDMSDGKINATIGNETINAYDAFYGSTARGYLGIQTYKIGTAFPQVTFSNVFVSDHNVRTLSTITIEKDGHVEKTIETDELFASTVQLSDGTLRHGQVFSFTFTGKDAADRPSNAIRHNVVYDTQGPTVSAVSFTPLNGSPSAHIEYMTDALASVTVSDDFSNVSQVTVNVRNQSVQLTFNGTWKGRLPSAGLPVGKHDVVVSAKDGLGNPSVKTFPKHLIIDDFANPLINVTSPNQTNSTTPNITITTPEATTCSATYVDATGIERTLPFDRPGGKVHQVTLIHALRSIVGEEVETEVTITCTDGSGNVAVEIFVIVVDKRPPIIGARANDYDLILEAYDRISKEYKLVTRNDRQLIVTADEPVYCRYDTSDVPFAAMSMKMRNYRTAAKTQDDSDGFYLPDGAHTYYISCEDRVGNVALTSRVVRIVADRSLPALLGNVSPAGFTNAESPEMSILVMRPMTCAASLQGTPVPLMGFGNGPMRYTSEPMQLADGNYTYVVTCGSPQVRTSSFSVSFIKDTQAPALTILTQEGEVAGPMLTLSGRVDEESTITVFNPNIVWEGKTGNAFSAQIPMQHGGNTVTIRATDRAGNEVSTILLFERPTDGPEVRIVDRIHGSKVSSLRNFTVSHDAGTLQVTLTDEQGASVALNQQDTPEGALFTVPELAAGIYTIKAALSDGQSTVGYDSTSFAVDPLAEEARISTPLTDYVSQIEQPISGRIDYRNVLVWQMFILGNSESAMNRVFERFNAVAGLAEDNNAYSFVFRNEIGHASVLYSNLILDAQGPSASIFLVGGGARATIPRPGFVISFDEPAKVLSAYVRPLQQTNATRFRVENATAGLRSNYTLYMLDDLPSQGTYEFAIQAEDAYGNIGATQYFTFSYSFEALRISLVNPPNGASAQKDINFTVGTTRVAECRYKTQNDSFGFMIPFTQSNASVHSASVDLGQLDRNVPYYVHCAEGSTIASAVFNLTWDNTAPRIVSATVERAVDGIIVEYPLSSDVVVVANEDVVCRYGAIGAAYANMTPFTNQTFATTARTLLSNFEDKQTYRYDIICENRAGLRSATSNIQFSVDLARAGEITILSPKSGYYPNQTMPVQIFTNKRTLPGVCEWGLATNEISRAFTLHQDQNRKHTSDNYTFPLGRSTVYVECLIDNTYRTASTSFIVDNTPPVFHGIYDGDYATSSKELSATFNFSDNESDLDRYEYAIGNMTITSATQITDWQAYLKPTFSTKGKVTASKLSLKNGSYYWTVRAFNKAGLASNWYSSDGVVYTSAPSVSCNDGIQNGDETGIDCGGRCGACQPAGCTTDADCGTGVCSNGVCAPALCSNGLKDIGETDVDCGGSCPSCSLGKSCVIDQDCAHRYCSQQICQQPSCSDLVKNGFETDLDCGGIDCSGCMEGQVCQAGSDCASGTCEGGVCAVVSCTDGRKNGLEADIDCGGSCQLCTQGSTCELDSDCLSGVCAEGICSVETISEPPVDTPQGMSSWMLIAFIAVAVLFAGAIGYFVYQRMGAKRALPPPVLPSSIPPPIKPAMPHFVRRISPKERLAQALRQRIVQDRKNAIDKEHGKIASAFDDGPKKAESAPIKSAPTVPKPSKPVASAPASAIDKLKQLEPKVEPKIEKKGMDGLKAIEKEDELDKLRKMGKKK